MEIPFERELHELNERLLTMGSLAEQAVHRALQAFQNRDAELATRVRDADSILDRLEVEVDERAIVLLAKAPLARDLRLVTMAMKISQNLERIGDEAAKIAKRARALAQEPPARIEVDLEPLALEARSMLKAALDAFVQRSADVARALIPRDQAVDATHKAIREKLILHMQQHPEAVPQCLEVLTVAKCLERIADHATNIAEDVVYLCEAADIRHTGKSASSSPTNAV
ncbi:phosphate signaling complex protein PhoU [Limisphaera ngatamarikiensis]|uniref:Phosphate-specific transport system accessory protein PhoU n=1 Tax=Limisphaera ngatamarikiensis TaxID=1324935 RepID=A0A6M1RGG4_9BACT|nr:phosphate signaling complex protein PhoU [Limisphaera ngatamarikiensis]NGO38686.1 phosphate signaling complex protein PhoU [Limisphaera ngatamarikiensis]